jgi:hypothetical protein
MINNSFMLKIAALAIVVIVIAGGAFYFTNQNGANNNSTSNPTITPQPTDTTQTSSPTIPTATIPPVSGASTVSFDFDSASPVAIVRTALPLEQTKDGVTAQFSSPSGAVFSVQNHDTTFYSLSQFQGNYLLHTTPGRDALIIQFSKPVTSITFTFATEEFHGASTDEPTNVTVTAFMDSTQVGSGISRGTWPNGDTYPMGTLTYMDTQPFNNVRIEIPFQGAGRATDFMVDTIVVTLA